MKTVRVYYSHTERDDGGYGLLQPGSRGQKKLEIIVSLEGEEMKRKTIAFTVLMFYVLALPLTVWADTQTKMPPPKKGVIFVVVRYNSRSFTPPNFFTSMQFEIPCVVNFRKGKTLIIRNENGKRLPGTIANGTKVTAVNMADGDLSGGGAEIALRRKGKLVVLGGLSNPTCGARFSRTMGYAQSDFS